MSNDRLQGGYDARYDDIYQRGGTTEAAPRVTSPAAPAPALPLPTDRGDESSSGISEVGPATATREEYEPAPRNPFDVWIWLVAAALTGLGSYFLSAPMLFERQYMEQLAVEASPVGYSAPWFSYASTAGPPLILLGVATAVTQLFILSIRHTFRAR
ncbi:MAG: hypothetical protein JWM61_3200 [Micrococcaceae bacterium]|nr:hypothetical protein [Micrococcaceae bacterium]